MMRRTLLIGRKHALMGLAPLLALCFLLFAQADEPIPEQQAQPKQADLIKRLVENTLEATIDAEPPAPESKGAIEMPLKLVMQPESPAKQEENHAPKIEPMDFGKYRIEAAPKLMVASPNTVIRELLDMEKLDIGKSDLEAPVELLIQRDTADPQPALKQFATAPKAPPKNDPLADEMDMGLPAESAPDTRVQRDDSTNPKVEPGKVDWHADLETARAASERSGKPVLLFHLLGQLDQRFT